MVYKVSYRTQHCGTEKRRALKKTSGFRIAIAIGFLGALLSLITTGCGDSSDDSAPFPLVMNGGYRAQLSATDLARLYPQPNTTPAKVNPEIKRFTLYVFQENGGLVKSKSAPYASGAIDFTVDGLPVTTYRLVIAGIDAAGDLVGAARTDFIFPLAGGLQLLNGSSFAAFNGFVLPDAPATLEVEVENIEEAYEVSWSGGNGALGPVVAVSAIPVDLLDDLRDGEVTPNSPEVLKRSLFISSIAGTDLLAQPLELTDDQAIPGVAISTQFEGFDGTSYRVTVTRANGDTGYTDLVLGPTP